MSDHVDHYQYVFILDSDKIHVVIQIPDLNVGLDAGWF